MQHANYPSHIDQIRASLTRSAFEALYGPFAWAYDWVSRTFFLGQWRLWQRSAIHHLKGNRVLELGMGTGNLQIDLLDRGYRVWGIDFSPQMLRKARAKARRAGVEMKVCRARAQALPFPDACFDSIVSTFPSEYICDPHTLSEAVRVLRPEGRLVVVPGGWLRPTDTRSRALEGIAHLVYGYKGNYYRPGPATQLPAGSAWYKWTSTLKQHMVEAGFRVSAYITSNRRGAALIMVGDKLQI